MRRSNDQLFQSRQVRVNTHNMYTGRTQYIRARDAAAENAPLPPRYLLIAHKIIYRYHSYRVEYTTIFITYFTRRNVKWINVYFHITNVRTERRESVCERESIAESIIFLFTHVGMLL